MFVSILRKIYSALTALFWSNRRKWFAGIATSFWAIQHIACAYGPDDGREPLETCTPIYDYDRLADAPLSTENYSECEQMLTEALVYLGKCYKPCENSLVMPVASPLDSTKTTLATYCRDEGRPAQGRKGFLVSRRFPKPSGSQEKHGFGGGMGQDMINSRRHARFRAQRNA